MNITKVSVKTLYEIEIDFDEFMKAYIFYSSPEAEIYRVMYPKAYEGYDLDNRSEEYVRMVMEKISVFGHGNFPAYIAKYLEFDGWVNAGHFHKPSGKYRMSVFNYGDCMNKAKGGETA